jgi:hypothetical protein
LIRIFSASRDLQFKGDDMPVQNAWRFCQKCCSMFYAGNESQGVCPANGQHAAQGVTFALPFGVPDSPTAQQSWRFCQNCEALFYDGYPTKGVCKATGAGHVAQGLEFILPHDVPVTTNTQSLWRFCQKCAVMFYSGYPSQGVCAAGDAHLAQGFDFVLLYGDGFLAPAPTQGLGSNFNYIIDCNCNVIRSLMVVINVTEEIVAEFGGWGFQLNCYSPVNETSAWQQYAIYMPPWGPPQPAFLTAAVNNWPANPTGPTDSLIATGATLKIMKNTVLPAGYSLVIALNFDQNQNVIGANYAVNDNNGNAIGTAVINLLELGVSSQDVSPIIAFELDLVGAFNKLEAILSSGAGTISYFVQPDMIVRNELPPCIETRAETLETSNCFYGPLPANGGWELVQSFNSSSAVPMIRQVVKPRPPLVEWKGKP